MFHVPLIVLLRDQYAAAISASLFVVDHSSSLCLSFDVSPLAPVKIASTCLV